MTTDTKKKRQKQVIVMSPPGTAVYPYLNSPERKFSKNLTHGDWKTGLRLKTSDQEVQDFLAKLNAAYDANLTAAVADEEPKAKAQRLTKHKLPPDSDSLLGLEADKAWKSEFDDAGQPTGYTIINFKRGAGGKDEDSGEEYRTAIGLFDAKNTQIDPSKVRIGGGSTIRVAFSFNPFATGIGAGISLRLMAVQVLERRDAPTKSAVEYGFRESDGFTVPDDTGPDAPDVDDSVPSTADSDDV